MSDSDTVRRNALNALSEALAEIARIGLGDLPEEARARVDRCVGKGYAIEFSIRVMPRASLLVCELVTPAKDARLELFAVSAELTVAQVLH